MDYNFINKLDILNNKYKFINNNLKNEIILTINNLFPKLNINDKNYIIKLSLFLIDLISYKYNFNKNDIKYYNQWTQNNNRDIKGVILLLLPFIDDKDNGILFKSITDLHNLLYSKIINTPHELRQLSLLERNNNNINEYFKYGNMGLGLINEYNSYDISKSIYNNKMIYDLIYHNFIGLLQTLEIINGKTYINWINIVPFNFNNYYNSNLYNETFKLIESINIIFNDNNINKKDIEISKILSNCLINYSGLWIGDIYNVFRIKFYQELKKIKWLIFPYETKTIQIYLIQGLNKMININFIINTLNYNYEYLLDEDKENFKLSLTNIINNITNNISFFNFIDIDSEILKHLLLFFINNTNTCNNYYDISKWKISNDDINNEDNNNDYTFNISNFINNIFINDIINLLIFINNNYISHLWNFLKDTMVYFKYSVLFKYLTYYDNNNNIYILNNKYYYENFNYNFKKKYNLYNNKINLKNIYNIAKFLSHNNDWTLLPNNYLSLTQTEKIIFFYYINNLHKFLNLNNNLKKQFIGIDFNYNDVIIQISNSFNSIFLLLTFEELIAAGSLNYFTVNINITDKTILPKEDSLLKKIRNEEIKTLFLKNEKEWNEAYYYLTNEQFKYTNNYLSNLKNPGNNSWLLFYAMDWVSQISFFHHYIFHQVLYITGATGQGKSTQVPKLLLYALKVIDYKTNGKIICTQPRTVPTIDNTKQIANQLGFPIINNNISTNNYYIQFKHQEDAHYTTTIDNHNLSLKIVTDGTLYEIIKNNVVLKKKINDIYINENIYDIIIIDEAHEHGINMDLILTLGRQTCFYNNQIRLIIVSATMDNDELIYRRYYKMVNDKLLYPIKTPIMEPFLNNPKYVFNPIFMDRRYHISPPGETTQYKIDEEYEDKEYEQNEILDLSINKVLKICSNTSKGDILVFTNGEQDIFTIIETLNKSLSDNIVAVPFYSSLHEKYMEIIKNAQYKNIKTKKENIHLKWKNEYLQDNIITNYNRIVIVSTNIAEASVTINSLTYVIDNGYAKVNIYDPLLDINKLLIEKISEASRLQRKGRVGRVGYGKVYYLYPKNSRKNIISKYKITQENFGPHFIKLLNNKSIEDLKYNETNNYNKLLAPYNLHPNSISFLFIPITNIQKNYYIIKSKLYDIFINNYKINEESYEIRNYYYYYDENIEPLNLIYRINLDNPGYLYNVSILDESSNIDIQNIIHFSFDDGQIIANLFDNNGVYFLIHYFESIIVRNIFNNIIIFNNKKINHSSEQNNIIINNNNYKYLKHYLSTNNLVINYNINNIDEKFIKTEIVNIINKYIEIFDISYTFNHLLTIFYANNFNCFINVFYLIILIHENLNDKLINIINPELNFNQAYKQFKKYYTNYNSELILLYNIIEKILNKFEYLLVFKINYNIIKTNLYEEINNIIKEFLILENTNIIPPKNYNIDLWNYLKKKKYNNELILDNLITDSHIFINTNIYKKIINNLQENEKIIQNWSNNEVINYKVVKNFINKIIFYKFKNIFNNQLFLNNLNFNKSFNDNDIYSNILKSFIFGNSTNISFYDNQNNKLISYFNINITYNLNKTITINNFSFVNLSNYLIFYYKYDSIDDDTIEISFINQFKTEWLTLALPFFYNNINFLNNYNNFKYICYDIINNWNYKIIWFINEYPILNNYYKSVIKKFKKIEYL